MSLGFWHRFPKKEYEDIRAALKDTLQMGEMYLNEQERERLSNLLNTVEAGFRTKQELDLNLDFLKRCLEFYLLIFHDRQKTSVKNVLKRIKGNPGG